MSGYKRLNVGVRKNFRDFVNDRPKVLLNRSTQKVGEESERRSRLKDIGKRLKDIGKRLKDIGKRLKDIVRALPWLPSENIDRRFYESVKPHLSNDNTERTKARIFMQFTKLDSKILE